jgi:hypothetical protein
VAKRNKEGMTWVEWIGAATGGVRLTRSERVGMRKHWTWGSDPTEFRNLFNIAKRPRRLPIVKVLS